MNLDHNPIQFHIFAFSNQGKALKKTLEKTLSGLFPISDDYQRLSLKEKVAYAFNHHDEGTPQALIFIGATGIAVRTISGFIQSKFTDPPVVVIDDCAHYVISLLSGHFGNANTLTEYLSEQLRSQGYATQPVITTATDLRGFDGFEPLIRRFKVNPDSAKPALKKINLAIANGEAFALYLDPRIRMENPIEWAYPKMNQISDYKSFSDFKGLKISIAYDAIKTLDQQHYPLISRSLVLGTGLKKDLPFESYENAFKAFCQKKHIHPDSIESVVSIDLKSHEQALLKVCLNHQYETLFLSSKTLSLSADLFEGSEFVKKITGVHAVAGPSAYFKTQDSWCFEIEKGNGCTFSIGRILL